MSTVVSTIADLMTSWAAAVFQGRINACYQLIYKCKTCIAYRAFLTLNALAAPHIRYSGPAASI